MGEGHSKYSEFRSRNNKFYFFTLEKFNRYRIQRNKIENTKFRIQKVFFFFFLTRDIRKRSKINPIKINTEAQKTEI